MPQGGEAPKELVADLRTGLGRQAGITCRNETKTAKANPQTKPRERRSDDPQFQQAAVEPCARPAGELRRRAHELGVSAWSLRDGEEAARTVERAAEACRGPVRAAPPTQSRHDGPLAPHRLELLFPSQDRLPPPPSARDPRGNPGRGLRLQRNLLPPHAAPPRARLSVPGGLRENQPLKLPCPTDPHTIRETETGSIWP